jgi:predicted dehydrogenase
MQKEERLLNIGVLGAGQIAQVAHFEAVRKARNAQLYAICDRAADLREPMRQLHQPQVAYDDYDAMLADLNVEAIIVAVADQFHVPLALKAVEAGKHVLVEKPLGVSVEEGEALARRVGERGVVAQVGTNKRFDPGIAYAARFIREEIGGLMALKAWYCDSVYRYTMTDNLQALTVSSAAALKPAGDPKANRRAYYMLGHGSHLFDTARFLGGEIVAVAARLVEQFGAYCWFISVEYASGAVGHLDLIIAIRGDWEEGFQVYGEHGSVKGKTHLPWFHKTSEVECFSVKDGVYRRPLGEDAYTYKLQVEGFADTILHGKPQHGATVAEGVAALRAMVAAARSVEAGGAWVRLDQVSGEV